jgi:glutaredoxin
MFCKKTKEFLSQKGVTFEERDITKDEAALEELQRLGLMTTPVTLVDEETVVGFDVKKMTS